MYYYTLHQVDPENDRSGPDEAVGDPSLTSTAAGDVGRLSSGGLSFH